MTPPTPLEFGWLIESTIAGRAVWWRAEATCGRTWTTDSTEAIRFSRKIDAERVIKALSRIDPFMTGAYALEHGWSHELGH